MTGSVVPFDPKRRSKRQPPTPPPVAAEHQFLHKRTRQATPEARELAAQQNRADRVKYAKAHSRQEEERLLRDGTPVPARITMALDFGGHEGPEVDVACGAVEPAVDLWECGVEAPTAEQVKLLSALTGFTVAYFYRPIEPGPLLGGDGRMFVCSTDGCRSPEPDMVDERGVLHYGGEPPRTPPAATQSALF